MKILNLYAGLGGNRRSWTDCEVTAVEIHPKVASAYQELYPEDRVCVNDAIKVLEDAHSRYDFIWASPPCITHSRARMFHDPKVPDMTVYGLVQFLNKYVTKPWCVENVVSWYKPLYNPAQRGRHYLWTNFYLPEFNVREEASNHLSWKQLEVYHGLRLPKDVEDLKDIEKRQLLRNLVDPYIGLAVYEEAKKYVQEIPDFFRVHYA